MENTCPMLFRLMELMVFMCCLYCVLFALYKDNFGDALDFTRDVPVTLQEVLCHCVSWLTVVWFAFERSSETMSVFLSRYHNMCPAYMANIFYPVSSLYDQSIQLGNFIILLAYYLLLSNVFLGTASFYLSISPYKEG